MRKKVGNMENKQLKVENMGCTYHLITLSFNLDYKFSIIIKRNVNSSFFYT